MPTEDCTNVINHIHKEYISNIDKTLGVLTVLVERHSKEIEVLDINHEQFKLITGSQLENSYKKIEDHLKDIEKQLTENGTKMQDRCDARMKDIETELKATKAEMIANRAEIASFRWKFMGVFGTVTAIFFLFQFLITAKIINFT